MTRFVTCPRCGAMNRDIDEKCYQCEAPLAQGAAPSGEAPASLGVPIPPKSDTKIPRYEYEESPVPKKDTSSTWFQGIRSGAIAGAVIGVLSGLFFTFYGGTYTASFISSLAGAGMAGAAIFVAVFLGCVIYGALLGMLVGVLNVLCIQIECMKFGSITGGIATILLWLTGGGELVLVLGGAFLGGLIGSLTSFVERSIFRQHQEGL
ncbi:MAG: hypothetical protein RDV48_06095 [Candidatus Eremiobacteraeota bacterium]|nr:hypothetical protein [Candidatus Eremiobacteraeota bacterium]